MEIVKIQCSNKHCSHRSGITVSKDQKDYFLKKPCVICSSKMIYIREVK